VEVLSVETIATDGNCKIHTPDFQGASQYCYIIYLCIRCHLLQAAVRRVLWYAYSLNDSFSLPRKWLYYRNKVYVHMGLCREKCCRVFVLYSFSRRLDFFHQVWCGGKGISLGGFRHLTPSSESLETIKNIYFLISRDQIPIAHWGFMCPIELRETLNG
jgi:hypothetical protein